MKTTTDHSAPPVLTRFRRFTRRAWLVHGLIIAGMIFQPVPMARSYWTDSDNDGVKEEVADPAPEDSWWTEDGDGDQWSNGEEAIYGSDPYRLDSDFDGLTDKDEHDWTPLNDPWAWSSDGSGFSDHDRYYHGLQNTPLVVNYNTLTANSHPFYSYQDADGDGLKNHEDADPTNYDRDADGIVNWEDVGYMDDPNNGGSPPDTTTDSDNDGIPDYYDPFPSGSYFYLGQEFGGTFIDTDDDTIPDPADPFPNGSYTYEGVEYPAPLVDQDGDDIPDAQDPFPEGVGSYLYAGTLYPGVLPDSDGDTIPDWDDAFPNGSYTYNGVEYEGPLVDQDGDGLPDWDDPFPTIAGSHNYLGVLYAGPLQDSDGDGIPDWDDPFPSIAGSHIYLGVLYAGYLQDSDGDTIPDWDDPFPNGSYTYNSVEYGGAWADQDNDGIPNPADPFPSLSGSYLYNGTQYGGAWIDTDEDGIPNAHDAFPNGSYIYASTEYAAPRVDTDADTIPDPADAFPNGSYFYLTIEYAGAWLDTDSDGIPDAHDAFPSGSYFYLTIEYAGAWLDTDSDGIPDAHDAFPTGSYIYLSVEYAGMWVDSDGDLVPDAHDPFPAIAGSYWYNTIQYAGYWVDTDGDGVPDPQDAFPTDKWNGEPHYSYNGTEYAGVWADYDEDDIPDPADSWPADPVNGLDNDGDGLTNYSERTQHYTNPNDVDSDDDYLTDSEELLIHHTNPLLAISNPAGGQTLMDGIVHMGADTDDDGLPDLIEKHYRVLGYGLSETNPADGAGDLDGDGVNNLQAYYQGWNLAAHMDETDRDGDGITDVAEDSWSAIYPGILDKTIFADAVGDYDQDGVFNFEEILNDSDPGDARSCLAAVPGSPLFNQIHAWRSDVEREDFNSGTDGGGNPVSSPAPAEYTAWEDVSPTNEKPDGYEYWIANRRNGIAPAPSGPLDGQILAWRLDVERADFTQQGTDTSGNPVFGPAPLEYLSWGDTPPENGVPDGYEHWVTHRLAEIPPPAVACNLIDQDGDGMSNEWEHRHRFKLRDPGDAGPSAGIVAQNDPGSSPTLPAYPTSPTPPTSSIPAAVAPTQAGHLDGAAHQMHIDSVNAFNATASPEDQITAQPASAFPDVPGYQTALASWSAAVTEHNTYADALAEYNAAVVAYDAAVVAVAAYEVAITTFNHAGVIDADRDGLSNLREFTFHTDPRCWDTDGDGFNDSLELANGGDPRRRDSIPPLSLSIQSGNNQSTRLGLSLTTLLSVVATRAGLVQAGVQVNFNIASGDGALSATQSALGNPSVTITSGSDGKARAYLSAPTELGSRTITAGALGAASLVFTVSAYPPPDINSVSLPPALAYRVYYETLSASGGYGAYQWQIQAGTLPAGLSLSSAGVISGTATVVGVSNFTVRVADGAGNFAERSLSIESIYAPSDTSPAAAGIVALRVFTPFPPLPGNAD